MPLLARLDDLTVCEHENPTRPQDGEEGASQQAPHSRIHIAWVSPVVVSRPGSLQQKKCSQAQPAGLKETATRP